MSQIISVGSPGQYIDGMFVVNDISSGVLGCQTQIINELLQISREEQELNKRKLQLLEELKNY